MPDSYMSSYLDTIEQDIEDAQELIDAARPLTQDAAHQSRLDVSEYRLTASRIACQNLKQQYYATRYVPS